MFAGQGDPATFPVEKKNKTKKTKKKIVENEKDEGLMVGGRGGVTENLSIARPTLFLTAGGQTFFSFMFESAALERRRPRLGWARLGDIRIRAITKGQQLRK